MCPLVWERSRSFNRRRDCGGGRFRDTNCGVIIRYIMERETSLRLDLQTDQTHTDSHATKCFFFGFFFSFFKFSFAIEMFETAMKKFKTNGNDTKEMNRLATLADYFMYQ